MRSVYTIIVFFVLSLPVFAQQKNLGTWHAVTGQLNLNKKWTVFGEVQTRSQLFFNSFFYYELKGGLGYNVNKDFSLLLGTGRYTTYSNDGNFEKPFANREFRIWQQAVMNNYAGRLKIEHRYRTEQRWLSNGGYRNRFRYRLNAILPINNDKVQPATFFVNAYDEVFLTNKAPHFERNRVYAGVGYMFDKVTTLQSGYLYQYDYTPATTAGKHFFQVSLFLLFNYDQQPINLLQLLD